MKLQPKNQADTTYLTKPTLEVVQQLAELIQAVGKHYSIQPEGGASSIGCHVRHIIDHFTALRAAATTGHINYNVRTRGTAIESDPELAHREIERLVHWLNNDNLQDRLVEVESEVSISEYQNICIQGSFHREIIYVISHTIHHIAYAKTIAAKMNIALNKDLGIAPATATYLRSTT